MKKLITIIIVLIAIGAVGGAYYVRRGGPEPTVSTLQISRGDVVDQVGATGTLQAVTTVKGKQVCYLQSGEELTPVPVTVGNFNDQFIEICAGLKEGDQVALTPPASNEDVDVNGPVLTSESARPAPTTTAKKDSPAPPRSEGAA